MNTPVISDEQIAAIAERYGISSLNAEDATHYKLCQVILQLEEQVKNSGKMS